MTRSQQRLERIHKAFSRLEHSIIRLSAFLQQKNYDEDEKLEKQDSIIKRFEICYELTWKYLKDLLEERHGIIAVSPKKVFHECLSARLLNEHESEVLLDAAEDRNITSHTYSEDDAEDICKKVCTLYFPTMETIINRLTNKK